MPRALFKLINVLNQILYENGQNIRNKRESHSLGKNVLNV